MDNEYIWRGRPKQRKYIGKCNMDLDNGHTKGNIKTVNPVQVFQWLKHGNLDASGR